VRRELRRLSALFVLIVLLAVGCSTDDEQSRPPQLGVKADDEQGAEKLGFPSTATRNTVRVGGSDAAADAAGVASALYPATADSDRPTAVVLADQDDWVSGIAAAVLSGRPIGAPILLTDGSDLPSVTQDVLDRLQPKGSDLSKDAQVIRIGAGTARPEGYKTALIEGDTPFQRAAAIDRFFSAARAKPSNDVVLYSAEQGEYAMPAAAWASRSGDAVLPVSRNRIAPPIVKALREHERPNVYVLGPESVIDQQVLDQLKKQKLARSVNRIEGPNPVENAIAFARYEKGDFGWGIVVPGYNFSVASTTRPADATASAALGTRGVFAPLLLSDDAAELPPKLEEYLLSVQPGYEDNPGQAVYNRAWIIGDDKAISVPQQAQIDQLTELVPVQANAP
jgi:molybdopterin-guanine dinucleotide biosynthesis protein A